MDRLTAFLLDHSKGVILFVVLLALLCGALVPFVSINYDLTKYLPEESESRVSLDLLKSEFAYQGMAILMAEDITIAEALALEEQMEAIDGVSSVLWLDDVADLSQPLSFLDEEDIDTYYKDGNALFTLNFTEDNYSLVTGDALAKARELAEDYHPAIYGTAEENLNSRSQLIQETINIMLVILPICLLILIAISTSWVEPILYLFVICIAVLINMGTNLLFDSVSFLIFSMGAALQLAVSMDYSLFLTHRFAEERRKGAAVRDAIILATKKTFPAVAASALTTIAGFSALALMQYGIGRDIGFVLAKGILFSFLAVIFFLPPLLLRCHKLIDRTKHRALIVITPRMAKIITAPRYLFLVLSLLIIIPCFLGQLNTEFLYGDSSGSATAGQIVDEKARLEEVFPLNDEIVILVPKGNAAAESILAETLEESPYIDTVQAMITLADPALPRSMLPDSLLEHFESENYSRMILYVNTVQESDAMFDCVDYIKTSCQSYYDEFYLVGKAASIADIKESVRMDISSTMLCSMAAVALIILLTFRSLIIPVLLVTVIQSAIYINMAVPYFLDQPLVFIGYLIVSSLQLGATIDYAILMASRYIEARATMLPRQAVIEAVHRAGISVLTSALILMAAGLAEAMLSSMEAISAIGLLIGRGAFLSLTTVLLVLPGMLVLFDRPIRLLTWRSKFLKKGSPH